MINKSDVSYMYYCASDAFMKIIYVEKKAKELCGTQTRKYFNTNASVVPVSDEQLASKKADEYVKNANEKTEVKIYELLDDLRRTRDFCFFGDFYIFSLENVRNIQKSKDGSTAYVFVNGMSEPVELDLRFEDGKEEYDKLYNEKLRYEQNKANNKKKYGRVIQNNKNCDELEMF